MAGGKPSGVRPYLRFSLRTACGAMIVAAVLLADYGNEQRDLALERGTTHRDFGEPTAENDLLFPYIAAHVRRRYMGVSLYNDTVEGTPLHPRDWRLMLSYFGRKYPEIGEGISEAGVPVESDRAFFAFLGMNSRGDTPVVLDSARPWVLANRAALDRITVELLRTIRDDAKARAPQNENTLYTSADHQMMLVGVQLGHLSRYASDPILPLTPGELKKRYPLLSDQDIFGQEQTQLGNWLMSELAETESGIEKLLEVLRRRPDIAKFFLKDSATTWVEMQQSSQPGPSYVDENREPLVAALKSPLLFTNYESWKYGTAHLNRLITQDILRHLYQPDHNFPTVEAGVRDYLDRLK